MHLMTIYPITFTHLNNYQKSIFQRIGIKFASISTTNLKGGDGREDC